MALTSFTYGLHPQALSLAPHLSFGLRAQPVVSDADRTPSGIFQELPRERILLEKHKLVFFILSDIFLVPVQISLADNEIMCLFYYLRV